MKKFLSIIIMSTFLLSNISVSAFNNFTNLGKSQFYYGEINGKLEKENGKIKTIYLLKDKRGNVSQIFSSEKSKKIKELFLNKNNVKILGQSYKNPNNKKYAGIFVNKIWNLDVKKIEKKETIKEKIEISEETKRLKKYIKEYSKFDFVIKNYFLLDQKILSEIQMKGCENMKKLFSKENLTDSEKFLFNEVNKIYGFEDFLDLRINAKNENVDDLKIIRLILSNGEKIINSDNDQLKKFLSKDNLEEIKKTSFSKDFQSKIFGEFKINFPQNFDYQEIKIGSEKFSKIYLKDFYSNILSFNFNQVKNFSKTNGNKSKIKLAGNYGEKIVLNEKIIYQIKNKSGEKFEISYSTLNKNFQEIFENILNKIEN